MGASARLTVLRELDDLELFAGVVEGGGFPRHFHERVVIQVVESGAEEGEGPAGPYGATAGDIVVCASGEVHSGRAAPRVRYRSFALSAELLPEGRGPCVETTTVLRHPALSGELLDLHRRLEAERSPRSLAPLGDALVAARRRAGPVDGRARLREEVAAARDAIAADLEAPVPVAALAAAVSLSANQLTRLFRRELGLPPWEYLTNLRCLRGKRLLAAGASPAEAALAAGFCDQSHFGSRFKRLFGYTPGRYARALAGPGGVGGRC